MTQIRLRNQTCCRQSDNWRNKTKYFERLIKPKKFRSNSSRIDQGNLKGYSRPHGRHVKLPQQKSNIWTPRRFILSVSRFVTAFDRIPSKLIYWFSNFQKTGSSTQLPSKETPSCFKNKNSWPYPKKNYINYKACCWKISVQASRKDISKKFQILRPPFQGFPRSSRLEIWHRFQSRLSGRLLTQKCTQKGSPGSRLQHFRNPYEGKHIQTKNDEGKHIQTKNDEGKHPKTTSRSETSGSSKGNYLPMDWINYRQISRKQEIIELESKLIRKRSPRPGTQSLLEGRTVPRKGANTSEEEKKAEKNNEESCRNHACSKSHKKSKPKRNAIPKSVFRSKSREERSFHPRLSRVEQVFRYQEIWSALYYISIANGTRHQRKAPSHRPKGGIPTNKGKSIVSKIFCFYLRRSSVLFQGVTLWFQSCAAIVPKHHSNHGKSITERIPFASGCVLGRFYDI